MLVWTGAIQFRHSTGHFQVIPRSNLLHFVLFIPFYCLVSAEHSPHTCYDWLLTFLGGDSITSVNFPRSSHKKTTLFLSRVKVIYSSIS